MKNQGDSRNLCILSPFYLFQDQLHHLQNEIAGAPVCKLLILRWKQQRITSSTGPFRVLGCVWLHRSHAHEASLLFSLCDLDFVSTPHPVYFRRLISSNVNHLWLHLSLPPHGLLAETLVHSLILLLFTEWSNKKSEAIWIQLKARSNV